MSYETQELDFVNNERIVELTDEDLEKVSGAGDNHAEMDNDEFHRRFQHHHHHHHNHHHKHEDCD